MNLIKIAERTSLILIIVFAAACASSNPTNATRNANTTANVNTIEVKNASISLADYLRRIPGVRVMGSGEDINVMVRSGQTSVGGSDPLYVIDGSPVGTSYAQAASMVDVNDIKTVRVLKENAETQAYGLRGSNGVILIRTKRK